MADPWDALLNSNPQQQDMQRNPDYDAAMGYQQNPGDDAATAFAKGLGSQMSRNTPQGRELTGDIIKQKLAAQVQIQLMQAKKQLEMQNPEYKSFITPYGAVLSVNPYNPKDTVETGGVPGAREAYVAKQAADTATDLTKASPQFQQGLLDTQSSEIALKKAQTDAAAAMPGLRQALIDKYAAQATATSNKTPKWTTEDDARVRKATYDSVSFTDFARKMDLGGEKAKALEPLVQANIAKAKAERTGSQNGSGLVAPEVPDMTHLMDLSNGGMPVQQDSFSQ